MEKINELSDILIERLPDEQMQKVRWFIKEIKKLSLDGKYRELQHILNCAVPNLKRWTVAKVIRPDDEWPKEIRRNHKNSKDSFFIYYNGAKSKGNMNEFESKKVPENDIDLELIRQYANNLQGRPLNKDMD